MVAAIRVELNDEPAKIQLNGAIANTTEETVVVDTPQTNKIQADTRLEHDDASGEERRVISVTSATDFEAERGYRGSTAATHADNTFLLIAPRWTYRQITAAIDSALVQLYQKGVYQIVTTRELTSSATTNYYNLPDAAITELLGVYQFPSGFAEPFWLANFERYPVVADTTDFAAGKALVIREQVGIAGVDVFKLITKERHTITTISTPVEQAVRFLACAELLDGREPRRLGGPTNQGDRTVRPGETQRSSAWYRAKADDLLTTEKQDDRFTVPARRNWIAG
jgi:hypothetical protein